jgi:hypothetical protein
VSKRQKEHLGRSTGDTRKLPGRDVEGPTRVRGETVADIEESREISREIDENEGYDRRDHRDPMHGASRGRKTKGRG